MVPMFVLPNGQAKPPRRLEDGRTHGTRIRVKNGDVLNAMEARSAFSAMFGRTYLVPRTEGVLPKL